MNAYQEQGFADRNDYLEYLCESYCVSKNTVMTLADLLGPNEDFDGLVSALADIEDMNF